MKDSSVRLWALFLTVVISGAAVADKTRSGSLRHGDYTAPDRSFGFRLPRLVDPGAFVRDMRASDDAFKVVMGDELCRRAYVVQYAAAQFPDFDTFVNARETALGMQNLSAKTIDSAFGAVPLRTGVMPGASVCTALTLDADGQLVPSPGEGSDAGAIFIAGDDAYYELGYLVGAGGSFADMYGIGSVDEVLGELLAGFRVTGPRAADRLPDTTTLLRFIDEPSATQCTKLGRIEGKSKSLSVMASMDSHMSSARARLRKAAQKLGANAIVVHESEFRTSGLTGSPYMAMTGEAMKCATVPQYMAWELPDTD